MLKSERHVSRHVTGATRGGPPNKRSQRRTKTSQNVRLRTEGGRWEAGRATDMSCQRYRSATGMRCGVMPGMDSEEGCRMNINTWSAAKVMSSAYAMASPRSHDSRSVASVMSNVTQTATDTTNIRTMNQTYRRDNQATWQMVRPQHVTRDMLRRKRSWYGDDEANTPMRPRMGERPTRTTRRRTKKRRQTARQR